MPENMKTHLCVIVNRCTKEAYVDYIVKAQDWYFARQQAVDMFRNTHKDIPYGDWCVDSVEI